MINNTQIAHKTQAMSTKEIAVLTDKRHADVLRDTRKMLQALDLHDNIKVGIL